MSSKVTVEVANPNGDDKESPKSSSSRKRSSRRSDEKDRGSSRRNRSRGGDDKGDGKKESGRSRRHRPQDKEEKKDNAAEGRDQRMKRLEKEVRDAKRKFGPSSNGQKDTAPGAQRASGKDRSSKKVRDQRLRATAVDSADSSDEALEPAVLEAVLGRHTRGGSSHHDDKRRERSSTRAAKPGAEASSSSRDNGKRKERSSARAGKPGAEASSSTNTRDRRKARGGRSSAKAEEETDLNASSGDGLSINGQGSKNKDESVVAATVVEDVDEEAQQQVNEAKMRQLVEEQTARHREETQRLRDEMERNEAEREEKKRKQKKRNVSVCLVLLVLIGGGVGAFFALQGGPTDSSTLVEPEDDGFAPDPSADPSGSPSFNPTDNPSSAPTESFVYEKPSQEVCERIAAGIPLDNEDQLTARSFDVGMQVELIDASDFNPLVPDLETKIEQLLVPDLIGCPREVFAERQLGEKTATTLHITRALPKQHRELQNIQYAIAVATITVTVTEETCQDSSSANCHVVTVTLDLRVRGNERVIDLAGILQEVFPNGENIQPSLGLTAPFDTVVVKIIRSNDPTASPTIAPTGTASENPTNDPTGTTSNSPSFAPVIGPTTSAPTKNPTRAPSKAPTPPPTLAPTSTPPPTFAPQPGLTPPPTPPPTKSPTTTPSTSPSGSPSSAPSSGPSSVPSSITSLTPTISTSSAPSPSPTSGPTSGPTYSPTSPAPTSIHLGCYADNSSRDMDVLVKDAMDVQGCRSFCNEIGFPYASLQAGQWCFCSDSYGSLGTASNCDNPCVVNSGDEHCGGEFANSVYMSGAPISTISELEADLYCGCTRDVGSSRDLEHQAPYTNLSQLSCIYYCRSKGYDFAGLQFNEDCYCGNSAGSHSYSDSCNTLDKNGDSTPDDCTLVESATCYDVADCKCGGTWANSLFRTSQSVSCPAVTSDSYIYLGCYGDDASRILNVYAQQASNQEDCAHICRDMGFPYAGMQAGFACFCGNQYDPLGTSGNCANTCSDGSECGGGFANSVYATGVTSSVATLESNLYCGCTADSNDNRDLEHQAPWSQLSQKACIHYCKELNYGLQFQKECWCGNSAGSLGPSYQCDTLDRNLDGNRDLCLVNESAGCYFGTSSCTCGGANANTLFRTSTSVTCPEGNLISKDLAVASFKPGTTVNGIYGPELTIDGNTCGDFFGCNSVSELLGSPTDPWWQVNLGFKATVKKIIVWNRTDCCRDRIFGVELQLLDSTFNPITSRLITLGENGSNNPASQTFQFSGGIQDVVYVRLFRSGASTLNIAEVQVFS